MCGKGDTSRTIKKGEAKVKSVLLNIWWWCCCFLTDTCCGAAHTPPIPSFSTSPFNTGAICTCTFLFPGQVSWETGDRNFFLPFFSPAILVTCNIVTKQTRHTYTHTHPHTPRQDRKRVASEGRGVFFPHQLRTVLPNGFFLKKPN